MNRMFRVLVAAGLVLALASEGAALARGNACGGPLATAKPKATQNATAPTSFTIALADWQNKAVAADASGVYVAVSGQRYTATVAAAPAGANDSVRFKSSKPSVASVNNRGVIHFGRAGTAVITATSKLGDIKASVTINVSANQTSVATADDKKATKIYLRGNILMMDAVIVNNTSAALTSIAAQEVFIKLSGESAYASYGTSQGRLKSPIAAGATGVATFRVKRVNPARIWLLNASGYVQTPST